ncbi:MAG: plastocyanin/azurin family copper-binding protein [Chloroflexota bacterium]|nr:plastocyanin/azurin family copper-binding protein [Chloroflexota bacterium]
MSAPRRRVVRVGRRPARTMFVLASAACVLALAACSTAEPIGSFGSEANPRVITVDLLDFRFEPAAINVRVGESIRIIAINRADLPHELFIGSPADQDRHHELHAQAPPDQQDQLDSGVTGIYVAARGTGQFTYRFDAVGEVVIGCHLVGHFEAGMVGVVRVAAN